MKRHIFQGNKIERRVIYDRLVLAGLLILFLVVGRGVWRLWQKNSLAEANMFSSAGRLKQLEERKVMLEGKLDKLKTSRGVEEEIRTNFSVVKPGEKVINIVNADDATTSSTTTPKRSWWQIF